ncbi:hypothetical protein QYE76_059238 [Lolium multiflorum]|uniref:Uncharacterized protein n=1 Tax=Lolium multiflorum TaxID=4521 RepID=A0AAD8VFJ5_LOLMU|nr:hypothetical protein QYE76_059238 [Lolium multiflorum]
MASRGGAGSRAAGLGGGDSSPRPPVFRSEAEQRKWNCSEGARKKSALRWTNWGLTPLGKLARYGNQAESSSSGQSSRAPRLPVAASFEEEELVPLDLQPSPPGTTSTAATRRRRNPSKEIFSELDETFAQVLFLQLPEDRRPNEWGHEAGGGRRGLGLAALPPGPLVALALTFRLLKASSRSPDREATIGKPYGDAAANPISGDSEIASGTAGEGFISRRTLHRHDRLGVMSE